MNCCRVLRKGSGVIFGESVFHMVRGCPKATPDPRLVSRRNSVESVDGSKRTE